MVGCQGQHEATPPSAHKAKIRQVPVHQAGENGHVLADEDDEGPMNVKDTRMRRLQELRSVWPNSPLGQNPNHIGCIELPGALLTVWLYPAPHNLIKHVASCS